MAGTLEYYATTEHWEAKEKPL